MITLRPDYYDDFECIAGSCRHTCCAGWEIDIDPDSMALYRECPDIMCHIKDSSFILQGDDERCPFLNDKGLCDLILKYGEDILCDVCTEHPRFYNYLDDAEYIGLGLCCEAALDLILDRDGDFRLLKGVVSDEGEVLGSEPYDEVPFGIGEVNGFDGNASDLIEKLFPDKHGCKGRTDFYLTLEYLDPEWHRMLEKLDSEEVDPAARDAYIDSYSKEFCNLTSYFLYRHTGNRKIASESARLVAETAVSSGIPLKEVCRMYAAEIEYSDVNPDVIADWLEGAGD